jgi:hypothetical protein
MNLGNIITLVEGTTMVTLYRGITKKYDEEINDNTQLLWMTNSLEAAKQHAKKNGTVVVYQSNQEEYYDIQKDPKKLLQIYELIDLEDSESKLNNKIRELGFKGFKGPEQKFNYNSSHPSNIEYVRYGNLKPIKFIDLNKK